MDTIVKEVWISTSELEGYYEVSNLGRVRSIDRLTSRKDTGTILTLTGKVLAQSADNCGYRRVRLCINKKNITRKVHRLVAEAFIENVCNKPQVNHIDGDKQNNNVSNLEWVTNGENQKHAIETGLKVVRSGESATRFERFVDVFKNGEYITTLAGNIDMKEKGFDFRLVSACLKGKRNTHRGCTFKIKEEDYK